MAHRKFDDFPAKNIKTSIYFGDFPVRYVGHNQMVVIAIKGKL
jgi:hypothetical protein